MGHNTCIPAKPVLFRLVVRDSLVFIGLFGMASCAPFVEYEHLSDPRIKNDGYDLICAGGEHESRLSVSASLCHNLAPNRGEFVKINVKYRM